MAPSFSEVAKTVCIIGYGVSGMSIATDLLKSKANVKIVVVTPTEYCETPYSMAVYTSDVSLEGGHNPHFDGMLKGVEYHVGKAKTMTDSSVTLDSGLVVDFDYAIVNSGVHIPFFLDSDKPVQEGDRKNIIKDKNAEIAKSKNIVISGGGAVSVEIASDIKLRNKNTSVTLVIPRTAVLEKMTEKYQVLALARLKEIGVVIVDNDRVTGHEGGKVNLKSSKTLPADMYFPCHATKVNSEFVPAASLDSKKYVMVEETFLVKGMKNVFATGDVTDRPVKGGFAAQEYAKHIVNNLANAIAGKPLQNWAKPGMWVEGPLMVAIGHDHPETYGVGPDLPWPCPGFILWCCCCCGYPCSETAGPSVGKAKSDWSKTGLSEKINGLEMKR